MWSWNVCSSGTWPPTTTYSPRFAGTPIAKAEFPRTVCRWSATSSNPRALRGKRLSCRPTPWCLDRRTLASVSTVPASGNCPMAKVVEMNGYRHLYARGITGNGQDGQPRATFREQCDMMFTTAAELLRRHDACFRDVLRTWCYLDDIDRDYLEFNISRNDFFQREEVRRLPASTGIRAGLHPPGALCGLDLYALLNPEGATVEVMHCATLNEAPAYGSSFSRGMKLCLPEKTVLFISGTASVDESGATAHVGDSRRQIERMLLNVEKLLAPHGAGFDDVVQVISYLKSSGRSGSVPRSHHTVGTDGHAQLDRRSGVLPARPPLPDGSDRRVAHGCLRQKTPAELQAGGKPIGIMSRAVTRDPVWPSAYVIRSGTPGRRFQND